MLGFGNISKGRNWLKFEDSNVGYQEKTVGAFNITLSTFVKTGGSVDVTLADIKPNQPFVDAGTLQFFDGTGRATDTLVYVNDAEMLEAFEADEGWYLFSDEELTDCKNATVLGFANGVVAKAPRTGSTLTYAGEVKASATEIPVGAFALTGNCLPKSITLANLVPNQPFVDAGNLQFFSATGTATDTLVYVNDAEMLEAFEADEGWYLFSDEELTDCKNSVTLEPGDAIVVKAPRAGSTLTVPSAL